MTNDVPKTAENVKVIKRKRSKPWLFDGTPGPGRPKGIPNKATQELGEAARQYTVQALETLLNICLHGEHESARVSAACALLDRGYGKPKQQVEAKLDGSEAFVQIWMAISEGRAG